MQSLGLSYVRTLQHAVETWIQTVYHCNTDTSHFNKYMLPKQIILVQHIFYSQILGQVFIIVDKVQIPQ